MRCLDLPLTEAHLVCYIDKMVQELAGLEVLANSTGRTIIVSIALIEFTSSTAVVTAAEYWLYYPRLAVMFEPFTVIPSSGNLALAPSCYRCI